MCLYNVLRVDFGYYCIVVVISYDIYYYSLMPIFHKELFVLL